MIDNRTNPTRNRKLQRKIIREFEEEFDEFNQQFVFMAIFSLVDPIIIQYMKNKYYKGQEFPFKAVLQDIIQWNYYRIICDDIGYVRYSNEERIEIFSSVLDKYCEICGVTYDKDYFRNCTDRIRGMDTTYKLFICLKMSDKEGLAVMRDISWCIANGADLVTQAPMYAAGWSGHTPLTYAIASECDPVIVRALKEARWDESFRHRVTYDDEDGNRCYIYMTIADMIRKKILRSPTKVALFNEYARIFCIEDEIIAQ
jgi:hypothetical protein